MRRSPALGVLTALTLLTVAGCSDDKPAAESGGDGGGKSGAGSATLTIQSFAYSPSPLTVDPGQRVSVSNKDGAEHTATSSDKGAFDSGDVEGGASASFTAPQQPGTYKYICKYHSSMRGTLVVRG